MIIIYLVISDLMIIISILNLINQNYTFNAVTLYSPNLLFLNIASSPSEITIYTCSRPSLGGQNGELFLVGSDEYCEMMTAM